MKRPQPVAADVRRRTRSLAQSASSRRRLRAVYIRVKRLDRCRQLSHPAEAGYLFSVGGTGDSPVPSGDPPDGTGRTTAHVPTSGLHAGATPVPLGESPSGAGGSPAPPTLASPFHLNCLRALLRSC